jgi:hypothetical protein
MDLAKILLNDKKFTSNKKGRAVINIIIGKLKGFKNNLLPS